LTEKEMKPMDMTRDVTEQKNVVEEIIPKRTTPLTAKTEKHMEL
jgi:hypothetical protein